MSAPMIDAQPIRFADYDLVRMLGRGGMAEVWSAVKRWQVDDHGLGLAQAWHRDSDRLVADHKAINKPLAVKVMHPSLSEDEEYRKIWAAESSITMQFSSANIVSVFEVGEHEGLLYMAMERIDGVNLHEFHQRVLTLGGLMPLDVAVRIIHEILSALFVAHEHTMAGRPYGIIHRDVKPANVLVSSVGDIRLTDFGIARPVSERNTPGLAPGTPRYMAPEQAQGYASKASDLYATGAIFEELLTGRRFRDECRTPDELHRTHYVIPKLERTITAELDFLRRALLHPDPAQRISSAREALSLIPTTFGHAKLKQAELYEKVVGMRSSGFTRNHHTATPSFLAQRLSFESGITIVVMRPPRPVLIEQEQPPAAPISDEDQTQLYGRVVPLLETDAPRRRDASREIGRPHRAAVDNPISHTKTGAASRDRPPTVTPTALLPPPVSGAAGVIEVDHTERQPMPTFEATPRPSPSPATTVPPSPEPPAPATSTSPTSPGEHQGAPTGTPEAKPTAQRRLTKPHSTATRMVTVVVIAAAMFAAGIATALVMQRTPKPEAPSESRP